MNDKRSQQKSKAKKRRNQSKSKMTLSDPASPATSGSTGGTGAADASRTTSDRSSTVLLVDQCIPSSELSYTLMSAGMSKRLGAGSTPPAAITAVQVHWQDAQCRTLYSAAANDIQRLQHLTAGAANSHAWLSWLRSNEMFSLDWENLEITIPGRGPTLGLEEGNGCIAEKLLPEETKTNRTSHSDLYLSYNSSSGLSLGTWLEDLRDLHIHLFGEGSGPVFRHLDGSRWTGSHYLLDYLHPWLREQKRLGDPMLEAYTTSNGEDNIAKRFFSMGTYQRGGRSHVQRKHPGCVRRDTQAKMYKHGRWAIRKSSEATIVDYNEMSVANKLDLTLLCM